MSNPSSSPSSTAGTPGASLRCGRLSLTVANLERAVGFYTRVCGLTVCTPEGAAAETVWLGAAAHGLGEEGFGLVLRQGNAVAATDPLTLDCDSPDAVDRIADQARRRGHLVSPPVLDPRSGDYATLINDPDANRLLFRVSGAASRHRQQQAAARRTPRWALGLSLLGGLAGLGALALGALGQLSVLLDASAVARLGRPLAVASLLLLTGLLWAIAWQGQLARIGRRRLRAARSLWVGWLSLYAAPAALVLLMAGWLASPIAKPAGAMTALAEGRWRSAAEQLLPVLGKSAAASVGTLVGGGERAGGHKGRG